MAKEWECTNCGSYETRGLLGSLRGEPSECVNCGSTEFESPIVHGTAHSMLDRFAP